VIADPVSVSSRTAWIFSYSPSEKRRIRYRFRWAEMVVGFSDKP
jgi:hypothetical protein